MTSPSNAQAYLPNIPGLPALPPAFGGSEGAQKPKRSSFFPTFLGSGSMPSAGQTGNKTLLGGAQ